MTGAEHYALAEQQLEYAEQSGAESLELRHLAAAQVHATLALADAQRRATEALRKGTR
jgi:hypothetical protein